MQKDKPLIQLRMQRYFVAPLASSRSLLALTGADSATFLQGLVSNSVLPTSTDKKATSDDTPDSMKSAQARSVYAGFFSAQGRLLHDTFILPNPRISALPTSPDYIIDHTRHDTSPVLRSYIKRFILRSKVKLSSLDEALRPWAIFPDPLQTAEQSSRDPVEDEIAQLANDAKGTWWIDMRASKMGYRMLLPPDASSVLECERVGGKLRLLR